MEISNKELGAYLRTIRESLGYSIYDVNKLCEISPSYMSLMENGKRRPSPIILKKLSSIYHINCNDLYRMAGYEELIEYINTEEWTNNCKYIQATNSDGSISYGIATKKENIANDNKQAFPILGTVKAGYNYLAQENIVGYVNIDKQVSDPENYFALKVTGNSMQPIMYEDDIVIVHRQNDVESGQIGIILIDNEEATVKKVIKHDNYIELVAFNSYYPPKTLSKKDKFSIIGKVTEARISKIFE